MAHELMAAAGLHPGRHYAWLRQEEDGAWLRIHEHDEAILDAAVARNAKEVAICGGRWVVTLFLSTNGEMDPSSPKPKRMQGWAGSLRSPYYESPAMPITRSVWCYKSWPNGIWTPFVLADDTNLEAMWDMTKAGETVAMGKGSGLVTLDGRHRINLKRKADGTVSLEMQPTDGQMSAWLDGRVSWSIERGWAGDALPPLPAEEVAYEEIPPSALVLLVHGMGETLWSRNRGQGALGFVKSTREACERMRSLAAHAQARTRPSRPPSRPLLTGAACLPTRRTFTCLPAVLGTPGIRTFTCLPAVLVLQARLPPSQRRRTEFLPVEWREGAVGESTTQLLAHITPQSVRWHCCGWHCGLLLLSLLSLLLLRRRQRRRRQLLLLGAIFSRPCLVLCLSGPCHIWQVPLLRQFANEVILDVLLYEQPEHRHRIQAAADRQTHAYTRYMHATLVIAHGIGHCNSSRKTHGV